MKTTDKKPRHNWRPFEEARIFVRGLGLQNKTEWATWSKSDARLADIPTNPAGAYKDKGWNGWRDWLGPHRKKERYRSFEESRAFVCTLGLKRHNAALHKGKPSGRSRLSLFCKTQNY